MVRNAAGFSLVTSEANARTSSARAASLRKMHISSSLPAQAASTCSLSFISPSTSSRLTLLP